MIVVVGVPPSISAILAIERRVVVVRVVLVLLLGLSIVGS